MHLLIYIDIALFIFIAFFIGYDLFFTLASFFSEEAPEAPEHTAPEVRRHLRRL